MFASSSLYFLARTTRNRAMGMLAKLRQPKYLIGIVVTIAYLWFVFFANPAFRDGGTTTGDGAARLRNTSLVLAGFYLLQLIVTWFALSSGRGVAFREAEVQLLFPRPFTRWQVLVLKWMSAQFPAVIGSLIVGFMFQRFGTFNYGFVTIGFLLNSTALYAHATLLGLLLARVKTRGGLGARLTQLPGWLLLTAMIASFGLAWQQANGAPNLEGLQRVLATPLMAGFLLPFTGLADVMTATTFSGFVTAAIYPVALIAVQALLIWRLDFPFEDQAVAIAAKIQNLSKEGFSAMRSKEDFIVKKPKSMWELATTGPVWRALVWKNVISMGRIPRRVLVRILLVVVVFAVILTGVLSDKGDLTTRVGFVILALSLYLSLLAPSFIRVDLRIDIPHFDLLKAMPLRGRSLIVGEVMGTVLVIWAMQTAATLVAMVMITAEGRIVFTWLDKIPAFLGLTCAYFAIDFVLVTSENLLALWMPGFVRLGRGLRPGFDQVGQNLIGALVRIFVLILAFLLPGLVGTGVGLLGDYLGLSPVLSIVLGTVLGSAILVVEAWLLIVMSERRYQRFDITSEKITEAE